MPSWQWIVRLCFLCQAFTTVAWSSKTRRMECNGDVGTFVQLTDIHYDANYTRGSAANCVLGETGLGCCRADSIPLPPYRWASSWGDFNCDLPYKFVKAAIEWMAVFLGLGECRPDFVFPTGDFPDHHDFKQSLKHNMNAVRTVTDLLRQAFPNVTVLPAIGNHEPFPVDTLFPDSVVQHSLAEIWRVWLPDHDKLFVAHNYYTKMVAASRGNASLVIVVINSLYHDPNNIAVHEAARKHEDLGNQYSWLFNVVNEAIRNRRKIWMVGHVPPGASESTANFSCVLQLLSAHVADGVPVQPEDVSVCNGSMKSVPPASSRYVPRSVPLASAVATVASAAPALTSFWGHTHDDEFSLLRDPRMSTNSQRRVTGYTFICPSLMPSKRNPSFRVYSYNRTTFEVLDYCQYEVDFEQQLRSDEFIGFRLQYCLRDAYNLSNVSVDEMHRLLDRFRVDDSLFQAFYRRYQPQQPQPCDAGCKQTTLCEMEYVDKEPRRWCMQRNAK